MSNKELNWDIQEIVPTGLSNPAVNVQNPVTMANGQDMDSNTNTTSCEAKINTFCMFENSNCFLNNDGSKGVGASAIPLFNDTYPECEGYAVVGSGQEIPTIQSSPGDFLNPTNPNFLGGPMMRQAIMVLLGIAILFVVSKGKPIKATAKAIKKAV